MCGCEGVCVSEREGERERERMLRCVKLDDPTRISTILKLKRQHLSNKDQQLSQKNGLEVIFIKTNCSDLII